jgi:hypothetical protein
MPAAKTGHVVLLGDSIFDNGAYVAGGPDVVSQLRSRLPQGWNASLRAVDGATVSGVERQLAGLPADASHLVVSAGGNDALGSSVILGERVASVGEAVALLASAQEDFAAAYERMLSAVQRHRLPTALCTIYDANYPEPQRRIVVSALALFNDVITRAAFRRGWPLIDLRLICNSPEDYANPIEPSVVGGDKIASAILHSLDQGPAGDRSIVTASA